MSNTMVGATPAKIHSTMQSSPTQSWSDVDQFWNDVDQSGSDIHQLGKGVDQFGDDAEEPRNKPFHHMRPHAIAAACMLQCAIHDCVVQVLYKVHGLAIHHQGFAKKYNAIADAHGYTDDLEDYLDDCRAHSALIPREWRTIPSKWHPTSFAALTVECIQIFDLLLCRTSADKGNFHACLTAFAKLSTAIVAATTVDRKANPSRLPPSVAAPPTLGPQHCTPLPLTAKPNPNVFHPLSPQFPRLARSTAHL